MKKKCVLVLMGIVMTATLLSACGQENTDEQLQQTTVKVSEEESDEIQEANGIYGEVTEITENSITIALGSMKGRGEKPEGEMPEGEKPEGEMPEGEKPEGEMPEGEEQNGEKRSMLELTGEEQTITITENTVISKMSMKKPSEQREDASEDMESETEMISLSDIVIGDTVSVKIDENGDAESIVVQSMGGGMGGSPRSSQ